MSAYLIVDVDDIVEYLQAQAFAPNEMDVAMSLRNTAALAAGLSTPDYLVSLAVADWARYQRPGRNGVNIQQVFTATGYDLFNVGDRRYLSDALLTAYFPIDSEATIDEMILVSSREDFIEVVNRLRLPAHGRVRVWSDVPPSDGRLIYQPLETILGVKTKSVALYVDFENIAISLNEQGFVVDLDVLVTALKNRIAHYGQVVHIAAYAPWGQRGSLPPMLDNHGREISDDVPSRLALESIDPVFSLPGKNSADLRIAKDVLADSNLANSAEIFIIASGDRDFNDIYNMLRARGKQVVVWGVRGSTSRVLENNASIKLEYIDDFSSFRHHKDLGALFGEDDRDPSEVDADYEFRPSQWSSLVLQYDYLGSIEEREIITQDDLAARLTTVTTTVNEARANELIDQAIRIGILVVNNDGTLRLRQEHPIVARTHLIRDHVVSRVNNTLDVRNWEYVNYGFLLKGIAMDEKLVGPGINSDDNWRSEWIDFLVRENILERELIPHRHNPDDLVPVIRVPDYAMRTLTQLETPINYDAIMDMAYRIIVSVEQFTSFRKFIWCPLGSLHKRLRPFDDSTTFQHAVEMLQSEGAIVVDEYPNPQSNFLTKGISLVPTSPQSKRVIRDRDKVITVLIKLYDERKPINFETLRAETRFSDHEVELWLSIMELENVLNPVPGQSGQYTLFRMHHTVSLVAGDQ